MNLKIHIKLNNGEAIETFLMEKEMSAWLFKLEFEEIKEIIIKPIAASVARQDTRQGQQIQ